MHSGPLIPANGPIVREVQTAYPIELNRQMGTSVYPPFPGHDSVLREYLRILMKRKWVIVASVVAIFTVVAIATLRSTPIYDASGTIAINKLDPAVMNFKDSAGNGGVDYYDPTDLDTEVRILRSDLLALQVIRQLNLDKRPEFGGNGQSSSTSLGLTTDVLGPDSARISDLLADFEGNLRVSLIPNTRIIEIHYLSADKELAPRVLTRLPRLMWNRTSRPGSNPPCRLRIGCRNSWWICK